MPVCPGCERVVSHEQLPRHERYCDGLQEGPDESAKRLDALASEIAQTRDTLSQRVQHLEDTLDRQTSETERQTQNRR
jgi:hypothetical protein